MSAKIRLIVTVVLVTWGLVDAVLSANQMPTFASAVVAFVISLFESLVFVAVVFVVWDWLESRLTRRKKAKVEQEPFPKLTPEQKQRAIEAVKTALGDGAKPRDR
jgi:hypothetical protein